MQDVFIKALASHQAGRRIDNLAGWLYAARRTTLVDYYRAAGITMERLDDDMADVEPDDIQMNHELSACLQPFINEPAPLYRDTHIATDIRGQTMRALAEAEGVSVSAIKSRAARVRGMLTEKVLACCHHRRSPSGCGGKCM